MDPPLSQSAAGELALGEGEGPPVKKPRVTILSQIQGLMDGFKREVSAQLAGLRAEFWARPRADGEGFTSPWHREFEHWSGRERVESGFCGSIGKGPGPGPAPDPRLLALHRQAPAAGRGKEKLGSQPGTGVKGASAFGAEFKGVVVDRIGSPSLFSQGEEMDTWISTDEWDGATLQQLTEPQTSLPCADWTMSLLLFGVTTLHVIILLILLIATLDKSWWVFSEDETLNLWYDCLYDNNTEVWLCSSVSDNEWFHAVQGLMVLAILFSSFSFILFMWQLYTMARGGLFYATGLFQIFASLCVFTGAVIYASHVTEFHKDRQRDGYFGYCFVLAWVAFPLSMVSGIMYIHLRKRE